ncbi:Hypothetical predicted protein, partial [Paramuricea clavata]
TGPVEFQNNYYITVNEKLTQPDAEAHCSKTYKDGTLYSFEDGATNVMGNYWTGIVYNERTNRHEFGNGTKFTFANPIKGLNNGRKLCLGRKKNETSIEFHTSKCCNAEKNFICKSPQEQAIN